MVVACMIDVFPPKPDFLAGVNGDAYCRRKCSPIRWGVSIQGGGCRCSGLRAYEVERIMIDPAGGRSVGIGNDARAGDPVLEVDRLRRGRAGSRSAAARTPLFSGVANAK